MFNEYVWFENSMVGVNLEKTIDFAVVDDDDGVSLQFRMFQDNGRIIRDRTDIIGFFENIARVSVPEILGGDKDVAPEIVIEVLEEQVEEQKQEIADLERAAFP